MASESASIPRPETPALFNLMSFSTSKGAEDKNVFQRITPRNPQCVLIGLPFANTVDSNKKNKTEEQLKFGARVRHTRTNFTFAPPYITLDTHDTH